MILKVISIICLCAIWFNCGYHVGIFHEQRKIQVWLDDLFEEMKKASEEGDTNATGNNS